jgi:hypothetical protein
MRGIILALILCVQAYGFWPFDFLTKKEHDPLPHYVLEHPLMNNNVVYGVGSGKNFLEAKTKALNDIATQINSDVRSITSVHKNTNEGTASNQQITVLTKRQINNYTIVDESHINEEVYLLISYKK